MHKVDIGSFSGKNYNAVFLDGVVQEVNTDSNSIVSGSGGSGHVSTDPTGYISGTINPTSINTRVDTTTTIWIKIQNDSEIEWRSNERISCRSGHEVILVYLEEEGGNGYSYILYNATTKTIIDSCPVDLLCEFLKLIDPNPAKKVYGCVVLVIGFFAGALGLYSLNPSIDRILFGGLFGGLIGHFIGAFIDKVSKTDIENTKKIKINSFDSFLQRVQRELEYYIRGLGSKRTKLAAP